ncbi:MAG: hypothetical protein D3926_13290 [Desulfobacteraceae bacterium]|nr:MAG: hypothetical protein D3926_13290 [Desulfobacteraceae bacterium]
MGDLKDKTPEELKTILSDQFSALSKSLGRFMEINQAETESQNRCNESVSHFFTRIQAFLAGENISQPLSGEEGYVIDASGHTKQEVVSLILSLRDQGLTFDDIAKAFIEKGIPTFSGRGEWHAQTIHRLFNSAKKAR